MSLPISPVVSNTRVTVDNQGWNAELVKTCRRSEASLTSPFLSFSVSQMYLPVCKMVQEWNTQDEDCRFHLPLKVLSCDPPLLPIFSAWLTAVINSVRPIATHCFLMTLQLVHCREECKSLPLPTIPLVLQQSDNAWSPTNVGLDPEEGCHTLDVAIEVRGRHLRRVEGATVVDADGLDAAAVGGGLEEGDDLPRSVESMIVPRESKLVTPARVW